MIFLKALSLSKPLLSLKWDNNNKLVLGFLYNYMIPTQWLANGHPSSTISYCPRRKHAELMFRAGKKHNDFLPPSHCKECTPEIVRFPYRHTLGVKNRNSCKPRSPDFLRLMSFHNQIALF